MAKSIYFLISVILVSLFTGCSSSKEEELKDYLRGVYFDFDGVKYPSALQGFEVFCLMHPYQNKVKIPEYIEVQNYINKNLESKGFRVPENSWYLLFLKDKEIFLYRHTRKEFDMVSPSGTGGIGSKWKNPNGYLANDCVAYQGAFLDVFFSDSNERRIGLVSRVN